MRSSLAITLIPVLALSMLTFTAPAVAAETVAEITAADVLDQLVAAEPSSVAYDRSYFTHWVDADGDGCDTRQEVLIAESITPVVLSGRCTVVSGQWLSWFDGTTWTDPSDIDIDHLVPLSEAWKSGAYQWTVDQRRAFANDLDLDVSLEAVTDNVNQSKGDRDPAVWLPPSSGITCRYVTEWVTVKYRWNLTVDSTERAAISGILTGECGDQPVVLPAKADAPLAAAAVHRFGGADRYEVAGGIAQEYTPGVPVVYIAKGTDYPDALSAAPAAAAAGGPLLLVRPGSIPPGVRAELQRLQPGKIVVVGGEESVLPAVFNELQTLAPVVIRLGGADRYETSRAVVHYAFGTGGATRVYLATGATFPDALSASAAAGARGGAVLLVRGTATNIDAVTLSFIRSLHPDDAVIAGGPGSVSVGIEASLASLGLPNGSFRLGGADRFETSRTSIATRSTELRRFSLQLGLLSPMHSREQR